MTRVVRWTVFVLAIAIASPQLASTAVAQPVPTVDQLFEEYCKTPESSAWFCGERKKTLSDIHKYDIVAFHCPQQLESSAPANRDNTAVTPPPTGVCEMFKRTLAPLSLEFDAKARQWSGKDAGFETRRRKLELDPVTKLPTAHLKPGDEIGLVVLANPLLYLANPGESKEENIEQIKALEQLLGLLGSATGGLIKGFALDEAVSVQRMNVFTQTVPADPRIADEKAFQADMRTLNGQTAATRTSFATLDDRLKRLTTLRGKLQLLAQQLEFKPSIFDLAQFDPVLESPEAWATQFEALHNHLQGIPAWSACAALFENAAEVTATNPGEPVAVHAATLRFAQLMPSTAPGAPCPSLEYVDRLRATLDDLQSIAQMAARTPSDQGLQNKLRDAHATARERHMSHALALARSVKSFQTLVTQLRDVLSKEEETRKASLVLRSVAVRVQDAGIKRPVPCPKNANNQCTTVELQNRLYLPDQEYTSSWTKVRQNTLVVSLNSPYADAVPTTSAKEINTSYRIVRAGFDRLSFGVGILYTDAYSGSFAAADPNPSQNTVTTVTTTTGGPPPEPVNVTQVATPEAKVIVEKDQEPRAGGYGLFVNYRFVGSTALGAGVQGGVATSADNPAFMMGAALNLSPYATLGGGLATFRVKRLGKGPDGNLQDVGDPVFSADDIRLRNTWDWTYYLSLSVNISGLPIFK